MSCEHCEKPLTIDRSKILAFQFILCFVSAVLGISFGISREYRLLAVFFVFIVLVIVAYPFIAKLQAADEVEDIAKQD